MDLTRLRMPVRDPWFCSMSQKAGGYQATKGEYKAEIPSGGGVRLPPTEMSTEQAWIYAFPLFSLNHRSVKIFS
jgi:hypothetical protein